MSREARGAQTAGPVGIHHGFLLFRRVAQATLSVGLKNGFVHRCHRLVNYDAYEIHLPESSGGAWDPAYIPLAAMPSTKGLSLCDTCAIGLVWLPQLAMSSRPTLLVGARVHFYLGNGIFFAILSLVNQRVFK